MLKQGTLEIQIRAVCHNFANAAKQRAIEKTAGGVQAAVQVNGPQQGLHGIPHNRCPLASPRKVLLLAQIEELSQPQFATLLCKHRLADQERLDLRQVAFALLFKAFIEILRRHQVQHGVAQKLQPFV